MGGAARPGRRAGGGLHAGVVPGGLVALAALRDRRRRGATTARGLPLPGAGDPGRPVRRDGRRARRWRAAARPPRTAERLLLRSRPGGRLRRVRAGPGAGRPGVGRAAARAAGCRPPAPRPALGRRRDRAGSRPRSAGPPARSARTPASSRARSSCCCGPTACGTGDAGDGILPGRLPSPTPVMCWPHARGDGPRGRPAARGGGGARPGVPAGRRGGRGRGDRAVPQRLARLGRPRARHRAAARAGPRAGRHRRRGRPRRHRLVRRGPGDHAVRAGLRELPQLSPR